MKNCVCKIHHQGQKGTGFFIKVPYYNNYLTLLIINNLLLDINDIKIDIIRPQKNIKYIY